VRKCAIIRRYGLPVSTRAIIYCKYGIIYTDECCSEFHTYVAMHINMEFRWEDNIIMDLREVGWVVTIGF
jgi:hypothetical protein